MTKWLSVFLVLVLAYFFWRQKRNSQEKPSQQKTPDVQVSVVMLPCAACGVLCPQTEMLAGKHGYYCSSAHRRLKEA